MGEALKKCGENVDCIRNYLVNLKDYPGVSGKINFDENGDLAEVNANRGVVKILKRNKR